MTRFDEFEVKIFNHLAGGDAVVVHLHIKGVGRESRKSFTIPVMELWRTHWECKYHIVFIPEYRRKTPFGQIRKEMGEVFHRLAGQKESVIEEGHLMPDHVHSVISIPPKYSVAQVVGFIKGKSAIHIARMYMELKRNCRGQRFWARGYFVSTEGRDEKVIREYIRHQEKEDRRINLSL